MRMRCGNLIQRIDRFKLEVTGLSVHWAITCIENVEPLSRCERKKKMCILLKSKNECLPTTPDSKTQSHNEMGSR